LDIVCVWFKNTRYSVFLGSGKEIKKSLKIFEKFCKKVLTNENIYDILHERSTEGRKNNGP